MAKETCVLCGAETPYDVHTHIDYRHGYIEGAGQLCHACYSRPERHSTISVPIKLIVDTPNDQELGAKVRGIYLSNS
jgi:hypothetical protein